ncbi:MAG: phosphate ABC transporter permease subunit PstC [Desulfurococcales archaeon]|nr:phosphate ABC transporter permease subunit PstC [Desulfurococcales archaeon]
MPSSMPASDRRFYQALLPASLVSIIVLLALFTVLLYYSLPAIKMYGLELFTSSEWRPVEGSPGESRYGLLIPIAGTIITALIAVVLATPPALAAVYLTEEMLRGSWRLREAFVSLIDIMAGMPTIVYGIWGLAVLAPFLKDTLYQGLYEALGFIPLFSCEPLTGSTVLTAGILLAIMIMPFMYSIIRESYRQIPRTYKEAALAIGATRYEYARIMAGMIRPALLAALLIGYGRAAGETVAVALVIGTTFNPPTCLLSPSYTVSSLIADQFANASLYPYMTNVLLLGGLVLLAIGLVSNLLGVMYLRRVRYVV